MSVSFQIVPHRGVVYVSYVGTALMKPSAQAFGAYAAHKDFAPGQKQIVDLSQVTGYERDYPRLFDLQMRKAEVFVKQSAQTLIVYFAPHDTALSLASLVARSWESVPGVHPRIVSTCEEDVLHLVGVPERSFSELLGRDDSTRLRAQG